MLMLLKTIQEKAKIWSVKVTDQWQCESVEQQQKIKGFFFLFSTRTRSISRRKIFTTDEVFVPSIFLFEKKLSTALSQSDFPDYKGVIFLSTVAVY